MAHDETVRTTLTAQHNQELIAKRLGEAALGEWKMYRRKRLNKNRPVTFQTFCDWVELKAAALPDIQHTQHSQSRESAAGQSSPRENPSRQTSSQQSQPSRSRESYTKRSSYRQTTPGAPTYCAWQGFLFPAKWGKFSSFFEKFSDLSLFSKGAGDRNLPLFEKIFGWEISHFCKNLPNFRNF